jgi:DNA-binding MarR family transcriptional regulator
LSDYAATLDAFADGLARICGIYGVNPLYGRLYGALFLSATPVALDDLADRVGAAKSTVSVAIRKLVDARVVKRSWRKADRRDWYEASTDPHQVMRDLVERYVRPELDLWSVIGGQAAEAVAAADGAGWPAEPEREVLAQRLADLARFANACESAIAAVEAEVAPSAPARRIPVEFE